MKTSPIRKSIRQMVPLAPTASVFKYCEGLKKGLDVNAARSSNRVLIRSGISIHSAMGNSIAYICIRYSWASILRCLRHARRSFELSTSHSSWTSRLLRRELPFLGDHRRRVLVSWSCRRGRCRRGCGIEEHLITTSLVVFSFYAMAPTLSTSRPTSQSISAL